jgi:hypothetical protein
MITSYAFCAGPHGLSMKRGRPQRIVKADNKTGPAFEGRETGWS